MSIIIDQHKRVLVQGITGREGQARTKLMRGFGTNVVAGCTPGKAGQTVEGVPVFDHVRDAIAAEGSIDLSVILAMIAYAIIGWIIVRLIYFGSVPMERLA